MASIGFTGSRIGPTPPQMAKVEELLAHYNPKEVHHGDCIGCDAWFHKAVTGYGITIHIHPPDNPEYRAYCRDLKSNGDSYIVVHSPTSYMKRNDVIVAFSDILIACPAGFKESMRSGTWATIRRARKKGIKIHIVYPNGLMGAE